MSHSEYCSWVEFYTLYPFDDLHRFHRPAALIATSFGGGDVRQRLDWLQPAPLATQFSDADHNTLKALGIRPPR